jgi:ABC-type bacteriocin/lantibiotic exporter with double-glycine peptidase domain
MIKVLSLLNIFQRRKLFFIGLLIFILGVLEIFIFSFLQLILNYFSDTALEKKKFFFPNFFFSNDITFFKCLVFFIFLFVFKCLITIYISLKKSSLEKDVNDYLSNKLYQSYLKSNYQFFINKNSSNLIANIITEVEKFSYSTIGSVIFLVTEIFLVICITIFLLLNYFHGTLFIIVVISIFFIFIYLFHKKKFVVMGNIRLEQNAKRFNELQKSFYIIQNIKLDHLEEYFAEKFKNNTQLTSNSQVFLQVASEVPKPIVEFIVLCIVIIVVYIAYFFFNFSKDEILTMLGIYAIALFRLLPSSNKILNCLNMLKFNISSTHKILNEIKSFNHSLISNSNKVKFQNFIFKEKITLEKVNFTYESSNKVILDDINLTIRKNEIIGISGASGSGKSTLLNIICFLLAPTSGKILIDDMPIEYIYKPYQLKIGYVSQKIFLIDDTFIQNIIFGVDKVNYDYSLFKDVIKKSDLVKVLDNLPLKENTIIGERGSKFSGGQQQRMGIARALYKNPEILILDEATNALDEKTEKEILNTVCNLKNNLTIILVSHKKTVLDFCDKVYEIKNGHLNQKK